jgi:hypothetical protein
MLNVTANAIAANVWAAKAVIKDGVLLWNLQEVGLIDGLTATWEAWSEAAYNRAHGRL